MGADLSISWDCGVVMWFKKLTKPQSSSNFTSQLQPSQPSHITKTQNLGSGDEIPPPTDIEDTYFALAGTVSSKTSALPATSTTISENETGTDTATAEHIPLLRGWLHAAAIVPVVAAGSWLAHRRPQHRGVIAAYTASFASMLAGSATYHRLSRVTGWDSPFRKLDHSLIFAAMAGTMTPVAAVALPKNLVRPTVSVLWGTAACGAVLKSVFLGTSRDPARHLYLPFGWSSAVLVAALWKRAGVVPCAEFLAGGIVYSAGAAVLARKRPDISPTVFGYHELWHAATLAAGALHFDAVRRATAPR